MEEDIWCVVGFALARLKVGGLLRPSRSNKLREAVPAGGGDRSGWRAGFARERHRGFHMLGVW